MDCRDNHFTVSHLIYSIVINNGKYWFSGPINWFLSLQVWKLHARLSYAIFLFHYMLLIAINNTATAPVFFSPGSVVSIQFCNASGEYFYHFADQSITLG